MEKTSNGVDGVLTAEHCHGLDKYEETSGGSYSTTYQRAALKSLGDAEWHTTTHTEYDDLYVTNSSRNEWEADSQQVTMRRICVDDPFVAVVGDHVRLTGSENGTDFDRSVKKLASCRSGVVVVG